MDLTSKPTFYHDLHQIICIRRVFMYYVGLFVLSAVVFRFCMFFRVFKMFLVGLATVVRLCFMSDIVY